MKKELANLLRAIANRLSPAEPDRRIIGFTDYLAENLNKAIQYSEYIAENLDAMITRVEAISGQPWETVPTTPEEERSSPVAGRYQEYLDKHI